MVSTCMTYLGNIWVNPMCGIRHKTGLRWIAFLDLVVQGVLLILTVAAFVYYEDNYLEAVNYLNNPPPELDLYINFRNVAAVTVRTLLSFCAFFHLQKLVLAIILFVATIKGNQFLIRLWIVYTLVLFCLHCLVYLAMLCFCMAEPHSIIIYTVAFVLREYTVWCVHEYLETLMFGLTDEESNDGDRYSYKL